MLLTEAELNHLTTHYLPGKEARDRIFAAALAEFKALQDEDPLQQELPAR